MVPLWFLTVFITTTHGWLHQSYQSHCTVDLTKGMEKSPCEHASCGEPLFLTPYIKNGNIEEGKRRAEVKGLPGVDRVSYSGYITVDETTNSNIYFWYWPAKDEVTEGDSPLVLWLQGGPGGSGLYGMFFEMGPYSVDERLRLVENPYSWNNEFAMLFIDQPVGTGFSFTQSYDYYTTSMDEYASQMYKFLQQFYQLFPVLVDAPFYITGESYGGKYVPALAMEIHTHRDESSINLHGFAIGDPLTDSYMFKRYSTSLYEQGLIDDKQAAHVDDIMEEAFSLIYSDPAKAYDTQNVLMGDYPLEFPSLYQNWTGSAWPLNFAQTEPPTDYINEFLEEPSTRRAIHVGEMPYDKNGTVVYRTLIESGEVMQSTVLPFLPTLIDNYKFLLYTGQYDALLPPSTAEKMLWELKGYKKRHAYHKAEREVWRVGGKIAGYIRAVEREGEPLMMQAIVRAAGHLVPHDQPEWALDLITRFILE